MKRVWKLMPLCLAILMLSLAGCKKSQPEPAGSEPTLDEIEKSMMEPMPPSVAPAAEEIEKAVEPVVEEAKETAEEAAEGVGFTGSIESLKAIVAQMDLAALQPVAEKYKTEILAKKELLQSKTDKMGAIPLAEKLSTEARALTNEVKQLTLDLNSLKARFDVYVNAIKDKGGDISALGI